MKNRQEGRERHHSVVQALHLQRGAQPRCSAVHSDARPMPCEVEEEKGA
jgi:2-C-methyl-D-erythritol 4-phosphate cytidylyltransferase